MNKKYQGFVMLPRDVQSLPLWDNPYDTTLWLYCVLHASHQPYRDLQPGQFYASQKKIAAELKWSRKTIGTCLRRLEEKEMIRADTSELGTVITVIHWDAISSGQALDETGDCELEQKDGAFSSAYYDEYSHQEQVKEHTLREQQFEEFWEMYPRKGDKERARKIFMKMPQNPEYILEATKVAIISPEWIEGNGRFVPGIEKWLNGGWEQFKPQIRSFYEEKGEDEYGKWISR